MSMDAKNKHPVVIEFLFFEGCPCDKMAMRIQNEYAQDASCQAAAF
jgi:hypothetical protein